MARWVACISFLLLAGASRYAAEEDSESASGHGELERGSPQYIYMQRLHSKLMEEKERVTSLSEEAKSDGTLLATSIEASQANGMTDDGFTFINGNILTFQLLVPKQKEENNIQKAELWLFPDMKTAEPGQLVDIYLSVTASIPRTRHPRREALVYTWVPEESAIPLDLSSLTRKISRSVQKSGVSESNVTLQIEVLDARVYPAEQATKTNIGCKELLPECNALQIRTNNNPFLVIKYYTYNDGDTGSFTTDGTTTLSGQNKRQAPGGTPGSSTNCTLSPLVVNLSDVYGQFIIAPPSADIGNCAGTCAVSSYQKYTSHALVKERVNWLTGKENNLSVCCVPSILAPLELLIYQDGYFLIVEFQDMIAKECSCR